MPPPKSTSQMNAYSKETLEREVIVAQLQGNPRMIMLVTSMQQKPHLADLLLEAMETYHEAHSKCLTMCSSDAEYLLSHVNENPCFTQEFARTPELEVIAEHVRKSLHYARLGQSFRLFFGAWWRVEKRLMEALGELDVIWCKWDECPDRCTPQCHVHATSKDFEEIKFEILGYLNNQLGAVS